MMINCPHCGYLDSPLPAADQTICWTKCDRCHTGYWVDVLKHEASKDRPVTDMSAPRPSFLALAEKCGARLTGKPDGSEAITIVFSIDAWRSFDASVMREMLSHIGRFDMESTLARFNPKQPWTIEHLRAYPHEALRVLNESMTRAQIASAAGTVDGLSIDAAELEARRHWGEEIDWNNPANHHVTAVQRAWFRKGWAAVLWRIKAAAPVPIDMVLFCPKCGMQHIDAPGMNSEFDNHTWDNPPHRSHLCHSCGHIWRPADVPTNGVDAIKTKGKNDSPPIEDALCENEAQGFAVEALWQFVPWVQIREDGRTLLTPGQVETLLRRLGWKPPSERGETK